MLLKLKSSIENAHIIAPTMTITTALKKQYELQVHIHFTFMRKHYIIAFKVKVKH